MSFTVRAKTTIAAPIELVWEVLTDLARYAEWSTMLRYEGGELAVGSTIALRLDPPEGRGYSFSPTVLALEPPGHFAWIARTGVSGVFDGEHHFRLSEGGDPGTTVLENVERYSGILSPLMKHLPQMKAADAGFEAMNREICARAEALHASRR